MTEDQARTPATVPRGFLPINFGGPFVLASGPFFGRWTGERFQLGFRVEARHTNPSGTCHGGLLATFCDVLLPALALYQNGTGRRHFQPTVSLQIDYLGPAPLGGWVQGEGDVLQRTTGMLFTQGLVTVDGQAVARASAVFRSRPPIDPLAPLDFDPFGLIRGA